jgi:photosystem II stability/assembly factor-like uncharacterized protein
MTGGEAEQHMHGIARSFSNPNIIYWAQDVGQVWKSENAGESWERTIGRGLYLKYGQSIEVDPVNPDKVFVIVDNVWLGEIDKEFEGVYRSTNGGDDWEFVLPTLVNFNHDKHRMYTHNIAFDLSSKDGSGAKVWYAVFIDNGLYRSDNYGSSWSKVADITGHNKLYGVYTHPTDGQTVYLASSSGLFKSTSKGANLQKAGNLPAGEVTSIAINPQNTNIVYATIRNSGLYKSTDGGNTFNLFKSYNVWAVFMNPGYPETMFLGGFDNPGKYGIIVTHDGGATWIENFNQITVTLFPGRANYLKAFTGPQLGVVPNSKNKDDAVLISQSHIYKTKDGGRNYAEVSTLFTGYAAWLNGAFSFDKYNPQKMAIFLCDVTAVLTENGGKWFASLTNTADGRGIWGWYQDGKINWLGSYAGDIQPVQNSKVIVASIGNYFRTKLMRAETPEQGWNTVTDEKTDNFVVKFNSKNPNIVYAGTKISYNAGKTFSEISFTPASGADLSGIVPLEIHGVCYSNPDIIYAMANYYYAILRSDDAGKTWRVYQSPRTDWKLTKFDRIAAFAVDPTNCNVIYSIDKNGDIASFDGTTWKSLGVLKLINAPAGLDVFVRTIAVDPNDNSIIYAGILASGVSNVWRSTNYGNTWEDVSYNLPRIEMQAMAVNPHTGELFVGSGVGTWILPPPYKSTNMIYYNNAHSY